MRAIVCALMAVLTAGQQADPWGIYSEVLVNSNPCYTTASILPDKLEDARKFLSSNPGSVILCPCFQQGLAQGANQVYNKDRNTSIASGTPITAGELFDFSKNNIDRNDLLVENLFVRDFTGPGGTVVPPDQLARYHANEEDVKSMIFAFMFNSPIRISSQNENYNRSYGGPFQLDASVFTTFKLIPGFQDATLVNTTRLWETTSSLDAIETLLQPVWVSHSVSLCYDLFVSAMIFEHNRQQIAPAAKPTVPENYKNVQSVEPWENKCSSYDCGFPGYSTGNTIHNVCPSSPGATGAQECIWCIEMSGGEDLLAMFSMPSNVPQTWNVHDTKGDIWTTKAGHAGEISVRSYCALNPQCTGYYAGQYGMCISKQKNAPHETASAGSAASVAGIEPHTFPFFMQHREYN